MITSMNILLLAAAGGGGASQMSFWIMIVAIFVIMYLFMIRPQKKKQKEIENFRKSLEVGQEVITSGGLHGTIRQIDPASNVVVIEIAKDVKVQVDKSCIFAATGQNPQGK